MDEEIDYESDKPIVKKPRKRGVIYLSSIPRHMNVIKLREILGEYGDIGRVFLQPGKSAKKNKPAKYFTEGWVEFESKRAAKSVAAMLNNKMIGGRKKSKFYDQIWNIKYLPRFKWIHLSERLAYEQSVRKQRLRIEIDQAKKEANHYSQKVEQSARLLKRRTKIKDQIYSPSTSLPNQLQEENSKKSDSMKKGTKSKSKTKDNAESRETFLSNLFS